ncbi:MarR family winged helix-turn-helix transcriptional regulator [Vagococcus sp. JNUCC 83]
MDDITKKLLKLLPYWHFNVERRIKQKNELEITYESYYCLLGLTQIDSLTMKDIAEDFYFGKQQTTRIVNQLLSHSFVEKKISETDKRVTEVSITPQGRMYLEKNPFDTTYLKDDLSKVLNDKEIVALNQSLDVLLTTFKKL